MKFRIQHFERLPSTNAYAAELLRQAPQAGTVIWADDQYAGRGQKGNTWQVEAGQNLTFSLIVYPRLRAPNLYYLSKATALALQETVQELLPSALVQIKWPNDLLVNGYKVAGILIENQLEGTHIRSSILGIGLNVNQRSFPPELRDQASSLCQWTDDPLSLKGVLMPLLESLQQWLAQVEERRFSDLNEAYLARLYGYRQPISVSLGGRVQSARLLGVEPSGRLVLDLNGRQRAFDVKEVRLLPRPEAP